MFFLLQQKKSTKQLYNQTPDQSDWSFQLKLSSAQSCLSCRKTQTDNTSSTHQAALQWPPWPPWEGGCSSSPARNLACSSTVLRWPPLPSSILKYFDVLIFSGWAATHARGREYAQIYPMMLWDVIMKLSKRWSTMLHEIIASIYQSVHSNLYCGVINQ